MQKWEYCIFTAYETAEKTDFTISYYKQVKKLRTKERLEVMAQLGDDGWELVGINPLTIAIKEFYFKRPKL